MNSHRRFTANELLYLILSDNVQDDRDELLPHSLDFGEDSKLRQNLDLINNPDSQDSAECEEPSQAIRSDHDKDGNTQASSEPTVDIPSDSEPHAELWKAIATSAPTAPMTPSTSVVKRRGPLPEKNGKQMKDLRESINAFSCGCDPGCVAKILVDYLEMFMQQVSQLTRRKRWLFLKGKLMESTSISAAKRCL
ncbi:uncharacterized protein LOC129601512 [Paramacrobiotus metropolitanus]|uniref:uncharacterized protein LOC129601512 n=1 Tax=Paramacrobiotus metropolitanus TaxID=2943436 RepID=UPI00244622B0|nr:uncharacterized protein LOC129601512 [Paramacrobiotus metropolitanus]